MLYTVTLLIIILFSTTYHKTMRDITIFFKICSNPKIIFPETVFVCVCSNGIFLINQAGSRVLRFEQR